MPTTSRGLVYPDSGGNVQLWTHLQNLATSADTAIGTAVAPGPICKLQLQTTHGVANSSNLTVPFATGTEIIKTDASIHSTTTNNTRVIPNKAGYYELKMHAWWATSTAGVRGVLPGKNGVAQAPEYQWAATVPSGDFAVPELTTVLSANGTTDYFEMYVFQNTGGTLNLLGSAVSTRVTTFEVIYLRPL
jgi:hypothetical protein